MCTTCINTNVRVPLTARRLTINFKRNSQIVTLSETGESATLTFMFTFTIYDTLVKRPPAFSLVIPRRMAPPCLFRRCLSFSSVLISCPLMTHIKNKNMRFLYKCCQCKRRRINTKYFTLHISFKKYFLCTEHKKGRRIPAR